DRGRLGLLQHDLADPDAVRIAAPSPGQVALVACEPRLEPAAQTPALVGRGKRGHQVRGRRMDFSRIALAAVRVSPVGAAGFVVALGVSAAGSVPAVGAGKSMTVLPSGTSLDKPVVPTSPSSCKASSMAAMSSSSLAAGFFVGGAGVGLLTGAGVASMFTAKA